MLTSPCPAEFTSPPAAAVHDALDRAVTSALESVVEGAMHECKASCGAVVSLSGTEIRVEAACPDRSWLRKVDLYIARSLLLRRGAQPGEVVLAHDRSYTAFVGRSGTSILILAAV